MSGGKTKTKGVQQQMVDPAMYSMLFGEGATQTVFGKGGNVKTPGTTGTGGLYNMASDLYQSQGPSGLNPLQTSALNQQAGYLNSPDAYRGYNALNQAGGNLLNQGNAVNVGGIPQVGLSGGAPQAGAAQGNIVGGSAPQADLANWSPAQGIDFLNTANAIRQTIMPGEVSAAQASYGGPSYRDAATRVLSGEVNNPYLQEIADYSARLAGDTFNRQVAPALRSGAQMSGQYGGSRQGIAEGLAASDLQRDILGNTSNLFGGAYENAQNRMGSMAGQLAGIDAQIAAQNAALQQQANLANQAAQIQAAQLGLSGASAAGNYGLNLDQLGLQGAGLQQSGNLANLGAAMDWAGLQQSGSLANAGLQQQANLANLGAQMDWSGLQQQAQQANAGNYLSGQGLNLQGQQLANQANLQGAAAMQDASQIPLQNLAGLYGVGSTVQNAPWNLMGNYANLLFPNSQLGSANTSNQTQQQTMGTGQILGGLAGMGLGMLGAPGSSILGGLIGGLGTPGSTYPGMDRGA